jgi:biotin operon repressor
VADPAFVAQIQAALDLGQAVIIPAPATPTPPPHDARASHVAALCRLFGLNHREGRILAQLLAYEHSSVEELRAAASDYEPIPLGSFRVYLSTLRKKLKTCGIQISSVRKLGYALERNARERIRKLLAKNGSELASPQGARENVGQ